MARSRCSAVVRLLHALLPIGACWATSACKHSEPVDPVVEVVRKNVDACQRRDVNAYLATLHVADAERAALKTRIEATFRQYDVRYELAYARVVSRAETAARVRFVLVTSRNGGPPFADNATAGEWIVERHGAAWGIVKTEGARSVGWMQNAP